MPITRPAKAAIFGSAYYLRLNMDLYLALVITAARAGLLASPIIAARQLVQDSF